MANHREIVGRGFRIGEWVIGLPSLVAFVLIVFALLFVRVPPPNSPELNEGLYRTLGMFFGGAHGTQDMLSFLAAIGGIGGAIFAVVLLVVIGVAALLYFTGRGVSAHTAGARVMGIALSVLFALLWGWALVSTLGSAAMIVPALGAAMAGYCIWVLGWK